MASKSPPVGSSLEALESTKTAGIVAGTPINHSEVPHSTVLEKYIRNVGAMNRKTAREYYLRLTSFQNFVTNSYKTTLDSIITTINQGSEDPYEILS